MKNEITTDCITLQELKQLIASAIKPPIIIDVRSQQEYDEMHIAEAMNIELSKLETTIHLFSKSDVIVTACGKGGGRSTDAAKTLIALGFKNTKWLCGGTLGWYNNQM